MRKKVTHCSLLPVYSGFTLVAAAFPTSTPEAAVCLGNKKGIGGELGNEGKGLAGQHRKWLIHNFLLGVDHCGVSGKMVAESLPVRTWEKWPVRIQEREGDTDAIATRMAGEQFSVRGGH